ncbi:MAG: efflux RND transporter periplasmic adaptor subunit [Sulfurimonas sp.]
MIKLYLPVIAVFLCTVFLNADNGAGKGAEVYVVDVALQPYSDRIEALGTLQANEQVALSASVTERVTALYFDDNQRVKKGDLLVELDAREEFAELAEEESRLAEASRQLKRLEPLSARGAASQSALDESRLEVETAQARIRAIRARIELRRIRAPFDGVLGLRNISVGSLVKNDSLIATIDDDTVMKLDFTVPSLHLPLLQKGFVSGPGAGHLGIGSSRGSSQPLTAVSIRSAVR